MYSESKITNKGGGKERNRREETSHSEEAKIGACIEVRNADGKCAAQADWLYCCTNHSIVLKSVLCGYARHRK